MRELSVWTDISYEALNVGLFMIIQPALIFLFMLATLIGIILYRRKRNQLYPHKP